MNLPNCMTCQTPIAEGQGRYMLPEGVICIACASQRTPVNTVQGKSQSGVLGYPSVHKSVVHKQRLGKP